MMTKKALVVGAMVAFAWFPARAQEAFPRWEVFGGLAISGTPTEVAQDVVFMGGWAASVLKSFRRSLGLKLDLGGQYAGHPYYGPVQYYQYLFGPQLSLRFSPPLGRKRTENTVFIHSLIGGSHADSRRDTMNAFTVGLGGGIDTSFWRRFAFRIVQFDYFVRLSDDEGTRKWREDMRVGAGFVIRF